MTEYISTNLVPYANLASSQCCNLKQETDDIRVWLCRVGGGVTVEKLVDGRWTIAAGSCTARVAEVK